MKVQTAVVMKLYEVLFPFSPDNILEENLRFYCLSYANYSPKDFSIFAAKSLRDAIISDNFIYKTEYAYFIKYLDPSIPEVKRIVRQILDESPNIKDYLYSPI